MYMCACTGVDGDANIYPYISLRWTFELAMGEKEVGVHGKSVAWEFIRHHVHKQLVHTAPWESSVVPKQVVKGVGYRAL